MRVLALTLLVLLLAPVARSQVLFGDSNQSGATVFICAQALESSDELFGDAGQQAFCLVAVDGDMQATDILNMQSFAEDGGPTTEFDLDLAPAGGDFLVNVVSDRTKKRMVYRGHIENGRFGELEKLFEITARGDVRTVHLPTLSHGGTAQAWCTRLLVGNPERGDGLGTHAADYTLHLHWPGGERTVEGVLPAYAFSPDEQQVAYLERVEDEHQNLRYAAARLVVEPVDGSGEARVVTYGYFLVDQDRPTLIWSGDGGCLYAVGQSVMPEPGRSLALFYNQTPKPRLFRIPMAEGEEPEKLWQHSVALWIQPSLTAERVYAFSYQNRKNGQARVYDAATGKPCVYAEGEHAGEECEVAQPFWSGMEIRPMPIWTSDDRFIIQEGGAWLIAQEIGEEPVRLPAEQQMIREVLGAPLDALEAMEAGKAGAENSDR